MITITEILDRSHQGMTRPFLCRADDGLLYYVKGRYAGQRSLCCEWVAGGLAQKVMAALFDVSVPAINRHLKRIFSDNKLEKSSVVKQCLTTAADGKGCQTKRYPLFESDSDKLLKSLPEKGGEP